MGAGWALIGSEVAQVIVLWTVSREHERALLRGVLGEILLCGGLLLVVAVSLNAGLIPLAVVATVTLVGGIRLTSVDQRRWVVSHDCSRRRRPHLERRSRHARRRAQLRALDQQSCAVHLFVVDNGSAPPAVVADERAQVLRQEENLGVGGGRNVGARAGAAPFICFLDSDARLHDGALAALLAPMIADATVGLTAPVFTGQRPEASGGRAPTLRRKVARALNRTDLYEPTRARASAGAGTSTSRSGACQVFRREAFDAVGGLDDSASFGPEDVDFCLRIRQAGWRVLQVASAGCDHPPRRAFKGLASAADCVTLRRSCATSGGTARGAPPRSGDVEHPLERDACPLGGVGVDDDLVHDLAAHE